VHQLFASSRYLILLAILGSFVLATTLFIYGAVASGEVALEVVKGHYPDAKKLLLRCIELVDVFLLATVFYLIALGFYELFIDDSIPLPPWLEIRTFDDLKVKLLGVVITVMGVTFLGQVATWNGQTNLLNSGGGIALVIASLSYYLKKKK
jgi:uncharacterized membrane protein YqhA